MTGIDCCLSREFHVDAAWRGAARIHGNQVFVDRAIQLLRTTGTAHMVRLAEDVGKVHIKRIDSTQMVK